MSKIVHHMSHVKQDSTEKSHVAKQSLQTTNINADKQTIINTITGYENDLGDKLERIDREAEIQVQQMELSECLMFVAQLVELFKHTVIMAELQKQNNWHKDTRNHLQQHNGVIGNTLIDDKVENIVISKGLTKEQWNCLLYISYSNGDTIEITKVSKKHLQTMHDKVSRLLEHTERNAVFALINALQTHMSNDHFTNK